MPGNLKNYVDGSREDDATCGQQISNYQDTGRVGCARKRI